MIPKIRRKVERGVLMTKVEKFNAIANMVSADAVFEDGQSVADFIAHEVEITNKRNSRKSSKPSKAQVANDELFAQITEYINENGGKVLAKDVATHFGVTSQKISGVVRTHSGVKAGKDKDGATYSIEDVTEEVTD